MTPTRWILTTLRKARENVCEQSSYELLNAVKFNKRLSWQHAMLHKILQFWAIFEPIYLRNTSYKWIDFLGQPVNENMTKCFLQQYGL